MIRLIFLLTLVSSKCFNLVWFEFFLLFYFNIIIYYMYFHFIFPSSDPIYYVSFLNCFIYYVYICVHKHHLLDSLIAQHAWARAPWSLGWCGSPTRSWDPACRGASWWCRWCPCRPPPRRRGPWRFGAWRGAWAHARRPWLQRPSMGRWRGNCHQRQPLCHGWGGRPPASVPAPRHGRCLARRASTQHPTPRWSNNRCMLKKRRYMFSPEVGSNFSGMQARLFLGGVWLVLTIVLEYWIKWIVLTRPCLNYCQTRLD